MDFKVQNKDSAASFLNSILTGTISNIKDSVFLITSNSKTSTVSDTTQKEVAKTGL